MGIYIPDMEMPIMCSECYFSSYGWCCRLERYVAYAGKKEADCPLVAVPDHGDLIDRSAALDSLMNGMVMTGYQSRAMGCVDEICVPTIIPADKEEL